MTVECLPEQIKKNHHYSYGGLGVLPDEGIDLEEWLEDMERTFLLQALEKSGGVRKRAAELLGINFRSIRYRLGKLGFGEDLEK